VSASNSGQWFYSNGNPQADYRIGRAGVGTDIGYALSGFSEVRAGYEIGYLNASLKLGTPQFSSVKGGVGALRFRFTTDHRDNPDLGPQRAPRTDDCAQETKSVQGQITSETDKGSERVRNRAAATNHNSAWHNPGQWRSDFDQEIW